MKPWCRELVAVPGTKACCAIQAAARAEGRAPRALQMPDLKTGAIHWEAKHEKLGPFDGAAFEDVHAAAGGVTTSGVAVRGSTKKGKGGYG